MKNACFMSFKNYLEKFYRKKVLLCSESSDGLLQTHLNFFLAKCFEKLLNASEKYFSYHFKIYFTKKNDKYVFLNYSAL